MVWLSWWQRSQPDGEVSGPMVGATDCRCGNRETGSGSKGVLCAGCISLAVRLKLAASCATSALHYEDIG